MKSFLAVLLIVLFAFQVQIKSQTDNSVYVQDSTYILKMLYDVPATSVKDQHRTGTCWDFATVSFLESEILREKGEVMDLSEMFIVRHTYPRKAGLYVRYHGAANFGPGGQGHDATYVIENFGIVPEDVYPGLEYGEEKHNHGELNAMLQAMLDNVIKKHNGRLTPKWDEAVAAVLDVYLGELPESFSYVGNEYNALSFAGHTGLKAKDYIELTSYNHHPFYERMILEVPDNWSNDLYYNVPLDDLIGIMENAFEKGYTVVWDGDVSDRYFAHSKGLALLPGEDLGEQEIDSVFIVPFAQQQVDQDKRQKAFDEQTSTDDHLMHLTGLYEDELGIKYYKTKNSWDTDSNKLGGYLYMSEPYLRLKTVAIMVHKDALPKDIAKKLALR